ncbi:MAG: hypothetical protein CL681_21245 [Blastopirellula sp.]|nr:hypothetical protein [Blastopirellula sp.]
MRLFSCLAVVSCLVMFGGCASMKWDTMPKAPWQKSREITTDYRQAQRMIVLWTPDVLSVPGKKPTRGFGGRVYFYSQDAKVVPVDGQLVIYGYDDTNRAEPKKSPDCRFVFTPDQFTQYFSETELGASYSIWIPWDEMGAPMKSISLLPVFTSVAGYKVVGEQTTNILPGKRMELTPHNQVRRSVVHGGVEVASHDQPLRNEFKQVQATQAVARRQPTTIQVTPSMSRRLQMAATASGENGSHRLNDQLQKIALANAAVRAAQPQVNRYQEIANGRTNQGESQRLPQYGSRFNETSRWRAPAQSQPYSPLPRQGGVRSSQTKSPALVPPSAPSAAALAPWQPFPAGSGFAPPSQ